MSKPSASRKRQAAANNVAVARQPEAEPTWECTNAHSLLESGAFLVTPHRYVDLLRPLVEYFVFMQSQPPSDTSATDSKTDAQALSQLRALSVFLFQNGTSTYMHETPLLELAQSPCLCSDEEDAGDPCTAAGDTARAPSHTAYKRQRVEGGGKHRRSPTLANEVEHSARGVPVEAVRLAAMLKRAGDHYLPVFKDDSEYLRACEVYCVQRQCTISANEMSVAGAIMQIARETRLSVLTQCLPCMQLVQEVIEHHVTTCMRRMPLEPRVVRVCRRLGMSKKETAAVTYLLLCHCGSMIPLTTKAALSPAALAYHNDLSPRELFTLLSEHRRHMKQGLLSHDAKYRPTFIDCRLSMPQEVVAALAGDEISEEQLIKLEKTALVEVLLSERRSHPHTGDPAERAQRRRRGRGATTSGERNDGENRQDSVDSAHISDSDDGDAESREYSTGLVSPQVALQQLGILEAGLPAADADALLAASKSKLGVEHGDAGDALAAIGASMADNASAATGRAEGDADADSGRQATPHQHGPDSGARAPYTSDIEYMEEAFKMVANMVKIRNAEGDMKDNDELVYTPKNKLAATMRELKGKVRVASAVHSSRVEATLREGTFMPRIEELSRRLGLSELEKQILLLMVGNVVSHDILIAINGRYVMREGQRDMTVGYILFVLCETLEQRVASRKAFYRSSPLVANGVFILTLYSSDRTCFNTDLMEYLCDIDRKIVDYLMGTETETSELVPGSSLVQPLVPMANVVLPADTTALVLSTIEQYSMFERCRRSCGFGEGLGDSCKGLVILFYGPSGTGKTMLAHGVAHALSRRLLVVNVERFRNDAKSPEMMRFIFREAKLNDAIIFFDECEGLFENRETNPRITSILAEFEKYDGLIIMATNAAQNMDEAMNRRISLMMEFKLPDHQMRQRIWRAHIPSTLPIDKGVSVERLALDYELSGGLIRNAVLAAISSAVARQKCESPTLLMRDFESGARQQLRGFFLAAAKPKGTASEQYITPRHSLGDLVLEPNTRRRIDTIAKIAKSRSILFSQWGFAEELYEDQGVVCLLHGSSGTGKTLAAEAIAYECGVTVRVCNVAELLLCKEPNVHSVFEEGRKLGAIVVFDEAQVLFNHTSLSEQLSQLIQYHAVRYPRPIIVIATTGGETGLTGIDSRASKLIFTHEVAFQLPSRALRKELWRKAFPEKVPLAPDVDFDILSEVTASAKHIRSAAFSACCEASRQREGEQQLTLQAIRSELEKVLLRERARNMSGGMFA